MLHRPTIEGKPKAVEKAKSFRVAVRMTESQKEQVDEIIAAIEAGMPLPEWAYRSKIAVKDDALLEKKGIMHLHIGKKNSRELLFLVQLTRRVVLLEISDHKMLEDEPRGTILNQLHKATLAILAAELDGEKETEEPQADSASAPEPSSSGEHPG